MKTALIKGVQIRHEKGSDYTGLRDLLLHPIITGTSLQYHFPYTAIVGQFWASYLLVRIKGNITDANYQC